MRKATAWTLALGFSALIAGYPWALSWALIPDPTPAEVRAQAERLLALSIRPVPAIDASGALRVVPVADIATHAPGPCQRSHETEGFGRRGFVVRVTHLCQIDLTLQDASTATAATLRQQWVGDAPEGLHEDPLLAEEHELRDMLGRLRP